MMVEAVQRWWYPAAVVGLPLVVLVYWSTRASARMMVVIGTVLCVGGAVGLAAGLRYLVLALSPENSSNDLKELGVALGVVAVAASAALGTWGLSLCGLGMRRRRTPPN